MEIPVVQEVGERAPKRKIIPCLGCGAGIVPQYGRKRCPSCSSENAAATWKINRKKAAARKKEMVNA